MAARPIQRGDVVWVRSYQRGDGGPVRLGMSVSNKAVGAAVQRNLVRRRIREVLRHVVRDAMNSEDPTVRQAFEGRAIFVTAQPGAASSSFSQLRDDLVTQLGRSVAGSRR
jgi:ribonuclease P protein component